MKRNVLLMLTGFALVLALGGCPVDNGGGTTYTVTFDTQGGSTIEARTVSAGSKVDQPVDPTWAGFVFDNWYDAATDGAVVSWPLTVNGNITVYAYWIEPDPFSKKALDTAGEIILTVPKTGGGTAAVGITVSSDTGTVTITIDGTELYETGEYVITEDAIILRGIGEGGADVAIGYKINVDHTLTITGGLDKLPGAGLTGGSVISDTNDDLTPPVIYTVTFDSQGGSAVPSQTVNAGLQVSKPVDPTKAGFVFDNWYDAATGGSVVSWPLTVNGNITVYARWDAEGETIIHYTVTFNTQGGSAVPPQTVNAGSAVNKPGDPTKAGFDFDNWYDAATGGSVVSWPLTVNSDTTVYARWDTTGTPVIHYTVTFDTQGGSAVPTQTVSDGSAVTQPGDPTRTGFVFDNWYDAPTGGSVVGWPLTVNGNITVYARWTTTGTPVIHYTVTFDTQGGSAVPTQTVSDGSAVTQPGDPTKPGFVFDNWYDAATGGSVVSWPLTVNSNITVYARWTTTVPLPSYGISLDQTTAHIFTAATIPYAAPTAKTVTITNTGNQATGALTIALSGTGSGSFTLNKTSVNIAAGGTDTFTVVPKTALAAGTYTATVTVSGSANITAQSFTVSFTVNALVNAATPSITGQPVSSTTYLQNATAAALTVTATVTDSGTLSYQWYKNTSNSTTGGTVVGTNSASYTPVTSAAGILYYYVVVTNTNSSVNGTTTATATSSVATVTVNAPTYGINLDQTTAHLFPAATFGYVAQTAKIVTITNSGNQATGALTVALSGANPGSFTLSSASVSSIAAGGNSTFTVVPTTGLVVGTYAATVTVSGGANITAKTFNVSFTVNPQSLTAAAVTGLVTPVTGATPGLVSSLSGGTGYTVDSISWAPTGTFAAATSYTATIVLTAGANYQFTGTITPTVNVGTPAAGSITGTGAANTLSFTVNYPATTGLVTEGSIDITAWVNEDGTLITSGGSDVTIDRSDGDTLTVTAAAGLTAIQWSLDGVGISTAQSITFRAIDYPAGNYNLGLFVYKGGIPYSTNLVITVTN
ncbi:hypothetical protein AGMMS50255_3790 [Spirochaetia bacterium]|nr:hypothetical protein AGMMS50255_3790 [Spirochaetia bacterium]